MSHVPEQDDEVTDEAQPARDEHGVVAFIKHCASRFKSSPLGPIRVLVVDDEEPVRKFVDRVLKSAGYATVVAGGGADAIEAASKMDGFDILVTDVMMPGMTGDELARRLRQQEPTIKVLYLTGFADRLFKEKTVLWEGEAFLDKPCSVKGLTEAVSLLQFGCVESRAAAI